MSMKNVDRKKIIKKLENEINGRNIEICNPIMKSCLHCATSYYDTYSWGNKGFALRHHNPLNDMKLAIMSSETECNRAQVQIDR
jgi:hypothetical protein